MGVVITGMGMLTAFGTDSSEIFDRLCAGDNAISQIDGFDCSELPVKFAGEIKNFDPMPVMKNAKKVRQTARFIQYGYAACNKALQQAGLLDFDGPKDRIGMLLGSGMGGIDIFEENVIKTQTRGPRRQSPFFIPMSITNMQPGFLAIEYGFEGPNYSISTACATGNHCLIEGAHMIDRGEADIMIVGGSEFPINMSGMGGFCALKALSTREDFRTASRPWDIDRDGFVVGEGSAVLVLEREAHARARGVEILARYISGTMGCDAHHITAPHEEGRGAAKAMERALVKSKLSPDDIDYINAHGTSTPLGDVAEIKAIRKVFGSAADHLVLNSTKSMLGHSLGAAAAIEACVVIESLRQGRIHPTINVENQDPQCDLNLNTAGELKKPIQLAMSNSFGFGGHNSSVILGRY